MRINLIYFGKASQFAAQEELKYIKRIKAWISLSVIELKPSKSKDSLVGLREEMKQYLGKYPEIPLIIMAEEGTVLSSLGISEKMAKWSENGLSEVNFLVGSSYGIHPELKSQAHFVWSLTPLTLTHDHARVILCEQVYRALCIQKNHPYHHV